MLDSFKIQLDKVLGQLISTTVSPRKARPDDLWGVSSNLAFCDQSSENGNEWQKGNKQCWEALTCSKMVRNV